MRSSRSDHCGLIVAVQYRWAYTARDVKMQMLVFVFLLEEQAEVAEVQKEVEVCLGV